MTRPRRERPAQGALPCTGYADEGAFQRAVAKRLDGLKWRWCHVPNGRRRDKRTAAILQHEGVKPGFPDVAIFEPWRLGRRSGMGIVIELKHGANEPSDDQEEWLADLRARGWLTAVCWTMGNVMAYLRCCRALNGRRQR